MLDQSQVTYEYDGTFEGLLCCVFESYERKEIPADIIAPGGYQAMLFPVKRIATDLEQAERVLVSIPAKMGRATLDFVQHSFLTFLPQKELNILLFLRLGYKFGPSVMNMLADPVVHKLFKAVTHLKRESHLLKGFVRFSVANNAMTAEIEPRNFVLPLLTQHFCQRFPEQSFLIHDRTHKVALIYRPYRHCIVPVDALELPEPTEEEVHFRELWKLFYETIAIAGRHNPTCRRSHMPKRYWKYMTEFGRSGLSLIASDTPVHTVNSPPSL
jgi:probable DNA metabolism protein